jgi:hypothetical protein
MLVFVDECGRFSYLLLVVSEDGSLAKEFGELFGFTLRIPAFGLFLFDLAFEALNAGFDRSPDSVSGGPRELIDSGIGL